MIRVTSRSVTTTGYLHADDDADAVSADGVGRAGMSAGSDSRSGVPSVRPTDPASTDRRVRGPRPDGGDGGCLRQRHADVQVRVRISRTRASSTAGSMALATQPVIAARVPIADSGSAGSRAGSRRRKRPIDPPDPAPRRSRDAVPQSHRRWWTSRVSPTTGAQRSPASGRTHPQRCHQAGSWCAPAGSTISAPERRLIPSALPPASNTRWAPATAPCRSRF